MKEIEKYGYVELKIDIESCKKVSEWEVFEIYETKDQQSVYLFKNFIAMDDYEINNELTILKELENQYDVLKSFKKVTMNKRYGFLIEDKKYDIMAILIRDKKENLDEYAREFGKLQIKLHGLKTKLELPGFLEYIPDVINSLKLIPEFQEKIMLMYKTIQADLVICHNEFVPYHILKSGQESFVIDWSRVGFADPMADVAKSIFALCSNYVPGIGPYLLGKKVKKRFIKAYLKEYNKGREINEENLRKWLVIFCAIEYEQELEDQGISEGIKQLYDYVDKYFEGEEVDYLDYLIYEP